MKVIVVASLIRRHLVQVKLEKLVSSHVTREKYALVPKVTYFILNES